MWLLAVILPGILLSPSAVCAQWWGGSGEPAAEPVGELFTGSALTNSTWISWGGMVKSFSFDPTRKASLYKEGWRLRVLGAYGQYRFVSDDQPNTANPSLFEITPGYQFRSGPLISKLYLGLHGEHHKLARDDPSSKVAGMGYGLKVISENWIDLPMNSFASMDGSYSTLNTSYQGMLRAGSAKFIPRLTIGPEAQIIGNEEFYQLRLGGFARWKLARGSIEGSAGYAKDYDKKSTPYCSFSWLKRF